MQYDYYLLCYTDNPGSFSAINNLLASISKNSYIARQYSDALSVLCRCGIECFIMDITKSRSYHLEKINYIKANHPGLAILVIDESPCDEFMAQCIRGGASDCLNKNELTRSVLRHAIFAAVERQKMLVANEYLVYLDELTGVYNRRGFTAIGEKQLKLAQRNGSRLLFLYLDLDDFKRVNDTYGHAEGDRALMSFAKVLNLTFRESDIIGRLGGDEFAVIVTGFNKPDEKDIVIRRLYNNIETQNITGKSQCNITASVGYAIYKPESGIHVQDILQILKEADRIMYEVKNSRKKNGFTENWMYIADQPN